MVGFSALLWGFFVFLNEVNGEANMCGMMAPDPMKTCVSLRLPWQAEPLYFCKEKEMFRYQRQQCSNGPSDMINMMQNMRSDALVLVTPWECSPMVSSPMTCMSNDCPPMPHNRKCQMMDNMMGMGWGDCCPRYWCEEGSMPDSCQMKRLEPMCMAPPKDKMNCVAFRDPHGCCPKFQCDGDGKAGMCPMEYQAKQLMMRYNGSMMMGMNGGMMMNNMNGGMGMNGMGMNGMGMKSGGMGMGMNSGGMGMNNMNSGGMDMKGMNSGMGVKDMKEASGGMGTNNMNGGMGTHNMNGGMGTHNMNGGMGTHNMNGGMGMHHMNGGMGIHGANDQMGMKANVMADGMGMHGANDQMGMNANVMAGGMGMHGANDQMGMNANVMAGGMGMHGANDQMGMNANIMAGGTSHDMKSANIMSHQGPEMSHNAEAAMSKTSADKHHVATPQHSGMMQMPMAMSVSAALTVKDPSARQAQRGPMNRQSMQGMMPQQMMMNMECIGDMNCPGTMKCCSMDMSVYGDGKWMMKSMAPAYGRCVEPMMNM